MKFVPWKDYKAVAAGLKRVCQSVTGEEAWQELDEIEAKGASQYSLISRSWRQNWANLNTPFAYSEGIRKYTTNAIESLNSVICKAIKKRKLFLNDATARKVFYLATMEASKN